MPGIVDVIRQAFKPGLRSARAHFGLYPFAWTPGWQDAAAVLIGEHSPKLQVAPVLERLVLPRAREALLEWLLELEQQLGLRWLVPAHYSAPLAFTPQVVFELRQQIEARTWAPSDGNWEFLGGIDQKLLDLGVVPQNPR